MERNIVYYKNYFLDFYNEQTLAVQEKIEYVIKLVKTVHRIPEKFLKFIEGTNGLYEMRIEVGSNIYRVFCFFDEGNLVILANGFQKKSQKAPKKEIERALLIKKEYEHEKSHKF